MDGSTTEKKPTVADTGDGTGNKESSFQGVNGHSIENDTEFVSTSAKKLRWKESESDFDVKMDPSVNYCFVEFSQLFGTLQQRLKCKFCDGEIKFYKKSIRGLGFKLHIECACANPAEINSCPLIKDAYEINQRFCFAMRLLGNGTHGMRTFLGLMDMTWTSDNNMYVRVMENIYTAVKTVYEKVIRKAGAEEKEKNEYAQNPSDILAVSSEGSWTKRGTIIEGFVSVIGEYSEKILDVAIKFRYCRACTSWKGKEDTIDYAKWYDTHQDTCNANPVKSAAKIQENGIIDIFKRSEEIHNAKYGFYIGPEDTRIVEVLSNAQPYGDRLTVKTYMDVTDSESDDSIESCPGLKNNKRFSHCIWQIAPKHNVHGKRIMKIATYCAACAFNEGYDPILKMLETMGVILGPAALEFASQYRTRRNTLESKAARAARKKKFPYEDDELEKAEGLLYGPGLTD